MFTILGVSATLAASNIRLAAIELNPFVGIILRESFKYTYVSRQGCSSPVLVGAFNYVSEALFMMECIFFHLSNLNYYTAGITMGLFK